jgi:hypothetical protein
MVTSEPALQTKQAVTIGSWKKGRGEEAEEETATCVASMMKIAGIDV